MSMPLPRPRKRLGQHFLIDPNIVRKILTLAALEEHESVLEIGPGRGILTKALCAQGRKVIAVEVDRDLFTYLQDTLAGSCQLDLRHGDALKFAYESLPAGTVVVANLPYNISTPLLFRLLEARRRLSRMILMLQSELARRIVAEPGSDDYGVLSVLTRLGTVPTFGFRVASTCFRPRPEVSSSVLRLQVRRDELMSKADEPTFVRTVRAAFAHRRKTLANSLRDEGFVSINVHQALACANIDPSRRAESLTLEEFAAIAKGIASGATHVGNP